MKLALTTRTGRGLILGLLFASFGLAGCIEEQMPCTADDECPDGHRCVFFIESTGSVSFCVNDFAEIPAAGKSFTMGGEGLSGPKPAHEVTFDYSYRMGINEVTVADFEGCLLKGLCSSKPGRDEGCLWPDREVYKDFPINCVTWDQAREYCQNMAGGRLCSESEWEFAARGAEGRPYPWGDAPATCDLAVISDAANGCGTAPLPVWQKEAGATPEGIWNMAGNVSEWVEDDYHVGYGGAPNDGSAWLDDGVATQKVIRGSSYADPAGDAAAWTRYYGDVSEYYLSVGIRCCMDLN